jgi:hypothetical protein
MKYSLYTQYRACINIIMIKFKQKVRNNDEENEEKKKERKKERKKAH